MNNTELAKKVWANLKGSAAKAKKFEDLVAVSISLLSEDNEDMFVAVRDGKIMVEPYPYNDNNCRIEATAETIDKMFAGELAFDKALKDGAVLVKGGDPAKLLALECLVPAKGKADKAAKAKDVKKPAAKAEKKPAVKEAAKPAAKEAPKAAAKPEPVKEAPKAKEAAKPAAKEAPKPAAKPEPKKPAKK